MIETLNFSLSQEYSYLFSKSEISCLWNQVFVSLPSTDSRVALIREMEERNRREGQGIVGSISVDRTYNENELSQAELFQLISVARFEPSGKECGTIYEDTLTCGICGAGRLQVGPLRARPSSLPKWPCAFASSFSDEIVVSLKAAQIIASARTSGLGLGPVLAPRAEERTMSHLESTAVGRELIRYSHDLGLIPLTPAFYMWLSEPAQADLASRLRDAEQSRKGKRLGPSTPQRWFQLIPQAPTVSLSSKSRVGIHPMARDEAGVHVCPHGHNVGLNLVSEAYFCDDGSVENLDLFMTKDLVGWHFKDSILYPRPIVGCSRRMREALIGDGVTGVRFERAWIDRTLC